MTIVQAEHHRAKSHFDGSRKWFNAQHGLDYSICSIQMFTSNALSGCWQNDGVDPEINYVCGDRNWIFGCILYVKNQFELFWIYCKITTNSVQYYHAVRWEQNLLLFKFLKNISWLKNMCNCRNTDNQNLRFK